MKKLGLIGGLGPEATVLYYQGIVAAFKSTFKETGNPEILIDSVDLKRFMEMTEDWHAVAGALVDRFNCLKAAGAQVGAICSNTPHIVFDEIQRKVDLPLISIVQATCSHAVALGCRKPLLLGTQFTMQASFYADIFQRAHIEIIVPSKREMAWIHRKIFSEIEFGMIRDDTRNGFLEIVGRAESDHEIDSVILGCTELPLILSQSDVTLPLLDTTAIHIDALVKAIR